MGKGDKPAEQPMGCGCLEGFRCIDCGVCTGCEKEYYMLSKELWLKAKGDGDATGMLCIGCLEARLGRELVRDDFPAHIPLNTMLCHPRSPRLRARLRARGK